MDKIYAVIDIGSNSIRYMEQGRSDKLVITTRLASGIAESGRLRPESIERSVSVIAALIANARHAGLKPVAYATSAVRDAANRDEFLNAVYSACGLVPDVLSGEREAEYAYRAAARDGGLLIDIGGGSMQLVTDAYRASFPIGCVRGRDIALGLTGAVDCDDRWPMQREALNDYMNTVVRSEDCVFEGCTGVGGSITTLAALNLGLSEFDSERVDGSVLTKADVEGLIETLLRQGRERKNLPLLKARHDVILYGAAILAYAMERVGSDRLSVSVRDGMEGYLDHIMRTEGLV